MLIKVGWTFYDRLVSGFNSINSDQVFQQQESELQGELCNNDEQEDVVVGPVGLDGSEPHLMSCSNDNELSAMLIEEVRKYPCIWDISLKLHEDKHEKSEAWRRISACLQQPGTITRVNLHGCNGC